MKQAAFVIAVVILLIIGGSISLTANQGERALIPGAREQTDNPEASVFEVTPNKGAQFILFAGFVLSSVVGLGLTLSLLFWLGNHHKVHSSVLPNRPARWLPNLGGRRQVAQSSTPAEKK